MFVIGSVKSLPLIAMFSWVEGKAIASNSQTKTDASVEMLQDPTRGYALKHKQI